VDLSAVELVGDDFVAFLAADFPAADFLAAGFFPLPVLEVDFLAVDLLGVDLLAVDFLADAFLAVESAMALPSDLLTDHQAFDQLVLPGRRLLVGELAGGTQRVHLVELCADRRRVVVGLLGASTHLLGHCDDAPERRRRERHQAGDKSHQADPLKS
jgi:hypothetical protein